VRPTKWKKQIRVKMAGELGKVWPEEAQLLMHHHEKKCNERGLVHLRFRVDGTPISLNHMYKDGLAFCQPDAPGAFQDKAGRWRKRSHELRPEVIDWRVVVMEAMGEDRFKWKPTGVTAALILFETPLWLTQKREVREMDVDNKTKPALDAVQHATDIPDELHWQLYVFKVLSKRIRTTICLYDLGDLAEYYY
jgi:hypothetical protein